MARPNGQHSIDIPHYLWETIDAVAAAENVPTNRLIAKWLWEHAKRHGDSMRVKPELAKRLRDLPTPYDRREKVTREYPRRATSEW